MKPLPRVCAHVKKGVCPKCRNPLRAPRSAHGPAVSEFHVKLVSAFVRAGLRVPRVNKRNKHRANVNGPLQGRTADVIIIDDIIN